MTPIKGDRICHLCGSHYREEKGHPLNDCWGMIHQQLLEACRTVRDLEYKLKLAGAKLVNKGDRK